jgi:voltage-gated potassium channel
MNHSEDIKRRERWLARYDQWTDGPMILLAIVWLVLLVLELGWGERLVFSTQLNQLSLLIWMVFILDFLISWGLSPHKWSYLRQNWLTVLAIALPAFRVFRILRFIRLGRSVHLLRLATTLRRGGGAVRQVLGRHGFPYVVVLTVLVTLLGSAGMAYFESPAALRAIGMEAKGGLNSYGEALWWTAMLVTTIGSEYWPQTLEGRILCWVLSVYALSIFGYIAATLASFFVQQDRPPDSKK